MHWLSVVLADEEDEEVGEDFQGIVWEGFDPSTSELLPLSTVDTLSGTPLIPIKFRLGF